MGAVSSPSERVVAGRYRLRRQLGQGAMGTVWEAYDEFLRRPVAVKEVLVPPGLPDAEADELRERTLREARAIAALSHPNVITLHDVARENGEPFVVTEYMPAHSLAELLRALGPLDTAAAAAVTDAVAAGLAAAHQVGITHRDVKPGNVLVGGNGQVKLTDFGIARNVSERTITRTGIMLGSPAYIAPEVAAGREVTPAADLWGLGATLFAVLEGHPPYDLDGSVLEIVNQVVHGDVPRPAATGPLAEVVAALMVKDPAARISLTEVRNRVHPLLPPPSTPLLSAQDLEKLADPDKVPTRLTPKPTAPPLPPPPPPPEPPQLAPAPGPLPFDATARRAVARRRRGRVASALLVVLAVVLFFTAAGGGFALARVVGGEALLPPARTSAPPSPKPPPTGALELAAQKGDAATLNGAQGGGFTVQVPRGWVRFVEERATDDLTSTRVYFVSPEGTRTLTLERFAGFYPDHSIEDYVVGLANDQNVAYEQVNRLEIPGIGPGEPAQQVTYRTTAEAEKIAPDNPAARNLNRVTFANLLPRGADLWVVAVTVPVDQEDTGRRELFDRIAPTFQVTG
ncbi:serine/threonine-protein kinase [Actinophytocola sp.]|jgi:tRNA A-37 threonylcarbamoyl transferase component Bud32|uniref:serine/threonine-protein kinase n=1 Tax=Actinophytocola sp. TaxID=1872138 RepID=UPI002ED94FA4